MDIQQTVAVVSGGASGLGGACVKVLAECGAKVMILDLDAARADSLLSQYPESVAFARCDITNESEVSAALDLCEKTFGNVTAAINCAGIAIAQKTLGRDGAHPIDSFRKVLDVNLSGTYNLSRLASERMAKNTPDENGECGVVLMTASVAAFDGQKGQSAYGASKGGVVAMTLPMARDLASSGIRVNTIAPGLFLTPMLESLPPAAREALGREPLHPKRLGEPEEFGRLAAFIVSHPYLNAETIRLDAGVRLP